MSKKLILILILITLLINTTVVFSSWVDWSRYEQDGYSFKIPEGFHHAYGPGSDENEYLVDNAGGAYTDFGSNRISIYVSDKVNNENRTLLYEYNNTLNFYNSGNTTIGVYETDNGTFITIVIYCWHHRNYDNERIEIDIRIIKTIVDSIKVD